MTIEEKYALILEDEMKKAAIQMNSRFNALNKSLSKHITSARINTKHASSKRLFWNQNSQLRKRIQSEYDKLTPLLVSDVMNATGTAFLLNDQKNIEFLNDYFSGKGVDKATATKWKDQNVFTYGAYASRISEISPRVLKYTTLNQSIIETYVRSGIITGRSSVEVARDLKKLHSAPQQLFTINEKANYWRQVKFPSNGKGVYKSVQKNLERITRTEMNRAYLYQDYLRMNSQPFVTGFEVKLSVGHNITDICDDMAGEYPKTFLFDGWHPNCLCRVTSILLKKEDMKGYLKTGKVSGTKYINQIPKGASKYVKTNYKKYKKMAWAENNFTKSGNVRKSVANTMSSKIPKGAAAASKNYTKASEYTKQALTTSQATAVKNFSSSQYYAVNAYARGVSKFLGTAETATPLISTMDDILAYNQTFSGAGFASIAQPTADIVKAVSTKGNLIVDSGFMFSSPTLEGIAAKEKSIIFDIENIEGMALADITGKDEILSNRNNILEILDVSEKTVNGKEVIYVKAKIV